ncbi:hypothetical protein [Candidimonas nitroreducens]|uniref:hypothetical protein n=1 Tax=Candidimonas nitroreducens TaxID=683354 RepID=UPI001303A8F1|nr:hypothetical protein [Candidimonas nitroreducens]
MSEVKPDNKPDPLRAVYERCAQIAESYPFSPCIGAAIAECIREESKKEPK